MSNEIRNMSQYGGLKIKLDEIAKFRENKKPYESRLD